MKRVTGIELAPGRVAQDHPVSSATYDLAARCLQAPDLGLNVVCLNSDMEAGRTIDSLDGEPNAFVAEGSRGRDGPQQQAGSAFGPELPPRRRRMRQGPAPGHRS